MKTIQIAICDDEEFFVEDISVTVINCMKERNCLFTIEKYRDARKLVESVANGEKKYDLLFLDIDMPEMSGVEAAEALRRAGYDGIICFVTSHDQYAFMAYGVEALGYIMKPARFREVDKLVEKALIQIFYQFDAKEAEKLFLEISLQSGKRILRMENILYLEKRRNQCVIHMEGGEVVCYETLKSLYERLNQQQFCYCHQGFVVNFEKIKEVQPTVIYLGDGVEVPLSRKYYKGLRERHMNTIYQLQEELRIKREEYFKTLGMSGN